MKYRIPDEYYFRLHHIRPRFKNNIENVLIFVASEVTRLERQPENDFKDKLNEAIRLYPENITKSDKTINNWRTEISSLFGFVQRHSDGTKSSGTRAIQLAINEDLLEFFKTFLYFFQYPGGHVKAQTTLEIIKEGIKFKPIDYLLKLMLHARESGEPYPGISKAEATHCVFNDLRVTRDKRPVKETWDLILANRANDIEYDWTGDVIRYAGDILDYMEIANLVQSYNSYYYSNKLEISAIKWIIDNPTFFDGYSYEELGDDLSAVRKVDLQWLNYVNQELIENPFTTDILALISNDETDYSERQEQLLESERFSGEDFEPRTTKDIGDKGEALVIAHEKMRVKIAGREEWIHLIKHIPTHLAMGYDVKSVEVSDGTHRFIEVKTTVSNSELNFSRVHLTPNEWVAAKTHTQRYYIYRLMISKSKTKLLIIQNPVALYEDNKLIIMQHDGYDLTFNKDVGIDTKLLEWQREK